jgi:cell division septum initiation protein DivIVA
MSNFTNNITTVLTDLITKFRILQNKNKILEQQVTILDSKIARLENDRYRNTLMKAHDFVDSKLVNNELIPDDEFSFMKL